MLARAPEEIWKKQGHEGPHPRSEANKEEAGKQGSLVKLSRLSAQTLPQVHFSAGRLVA